MAGLMAASRTQQRSGSLQSLCLSQKAPAMKNQHKVSDSDLTNLGNLKKAFSFEPHFLTAPKFLTGFHPINME